MLVLVQLERCCKHSVLIFLSLLLLENGNLGWSVVQKFKAKRVIDTCHMYVDSGFMTSQSASKRVMPVTFLNRSVYAECTLQTRGEIKTERHTMQTADYKLF